MKDLCPNKELCGSCSWSHIPYGKQLQQKLNDINYSFAIHKFNFRCEQIEASPKTSHYRNRMDFVINFEGLMGLRQKGKWWRTIDNHTCFISDELIEQLFTVVRDWVHTAGLSFFDRKSHEGLLRYAVIRTTTTGEAMVTIVTSEPGIDESQKLSEQLSTLSKLVTLSSQSKQPKTNEVRNLPTVIHSVNHTNSDVSHGGENRIISGNGFITEQINGYKYRITPNAFFQTNSYGAKVLMDTVLEFAEQVTRNKRQGTSHKSCSSISNPATSGDAEKSQLPTEHSLITTSTILDLYCGSGFFTIPLSKLAEKTVGIEIIEEAIADAKENNKLNGTNVEFIAIPSEEYDWSNLNPDLIIVDPPRTGLSKKVLSNLTTFSSRSEKPSSLIYVSCNYKNFSKDMETLLDVYEVKAMKAVDMFPHTPHVELVTLLQKRS